MPRSSLPPDPTLGNALRHFRKQRKMSQESVSHAADITLGAYGRIERSEVAPTWPTVRAIARGLGISMAELGAAVDRQGKA
jgi:XRE family transcriptional regulator, regulator of sulfur utilization